MMEGKRVFPAMDIAKSRTRKEELLVPQDVCARRNLNPMGPKDGIEFQPHRL